MRNMGGLWRKIPKTCVLMIIGTLAITGVGIPLVFGHGVGFLQVSIQKILLLDLHLLLIVYLQILLFILVFL